jgi:ribosomal protein S18 acetylase RimI-like enzyme
MEVNKRGIRPLTGADAAAFRAMRLQAIADSPSAVWPTHEEEAGLGPVENAARIEQTDLQVIFGAFIDSQLAGIAGLRREPLAQVRHKAVIWGVFIDPAYRREGLARALFARIASFAREAGVLQMHLCVNTENVRAHALYRSLGFTSCGVEPRAMRVGERYFDEERMVLRLDTC